MSWINITKRIPTWVLLSGLLGVSQVPMANAAVQEIMAVFKPDPANPMNNTFENKTQQSPICGGHIEATCKALNIFSLRTGAITFTNNKTIQANHENVRDGVMHKVPSEFREREVIDVVTGKTEKINIRIAAIGGGWVTTNPLGSDAFGGRYDWRIAYPPCVSSNYIAAGNTHVTFFWIVPEGAGTCSRTAIVDIPSFRQTSIDYAYELKTPNPLDMPTGTYKGSIRYTVGPGMDIDFGDVMIPNDSELILNFTLHVEHTLKVEIPPGGNRVELVPQGGWQSWLQQGRRPTRLFRDQTFNISASSRFKMLLECQSSPDGKTCWMQDPVSGHEVPLNISVSLPNGLADAGGHPVNRRPLLLGGSGTELFQPGFYVDRKPGTLHFEIPQSEVAGMIGTGAQRKYSGNVTVIWDSEV